jgi:hypothetical protein
MKIFNGILSIVLLIGSMYMMFFVKEVNINLRDLPVILGFGLMMMGMIFFLFMLLEERKEEIDQLKQIFWNRSKH